MKISLKKMASALYNRALVANNPYHFFGIPNADYSTVGHSISLKKLGIVVDKVEGENILRGYPFAVKIKEQLGGAFRVERGDTYLEFDSLCFRINSAEELFIIYEVFVSGVYNYTCIRDAAVIDVGMNSGITTLFYALNPRVKRIFSFELFRPTYLLGEHNLQLNRNYADKVKTFNFGLSDQDFETDVDYSLSRKGRMGLSGPPADEVFRDTKKEHVVVRDIKKVFEDVLDLCQGLDIIVKMDCEGEEFKLIERLSEASLLGKLTVIMLEWHHKRPTQIQNQLIDAGFHVFSQTLPGLDSGMIYACNRNPGNS